MLVASLILTKRERRYRSALKIDQEDLYRKGDSVMAVARAFEERAVELCHNNLLVNVPTRYAEQTGLRKES